MKGLFADFVGLDMQSCLEETWAWLLSGHYSVLAITQLGDWLLADPAGKVWLLDTIEGRLIALAGSVEQLEHLSESAQWRDERLLEGLVASIAGTLGALPAGSVYAFAPPPILAGKADKESAMVLPLRAYQSFMGQLHRQLQDKPDR